jgi:putative peptidoglycan binding protein/L,D-transpeptidase-like protein
VALIAALLALPPAASAAAASAQFKGPTRHARGGDPRPTVRPGQQSEDVQALQKRLRQLKFYPGRTDGYYDEYTKTAVWAFQKSQGIRPTAAVRARTWRALAKPRRIKPLTRHRPRERVEIDLRRQLLFVYHRGRLALAAHISTGTGKRYCHHGRCGHAITPKGSFRVIRRVRGWERSWLGWMYRSLYIYGGIAMHGSINVPLRPASHGCIRLPMHVADRVPRLVRNGERVYVH